MGTHLNRTVTYSEDEQLQESAEGDEEGDEEIDIEGLNYIFENLMEKYDYKEFI